MSLLAAPHLTVAHKPEVDKFNKGLENFGIRLFSQLAKKNTGKNLLVSPFSIQVCLALARMAAEGETALEMDQAMALTPQSRDDLAQKYHDILALYENNPILKIANKIYLMQGYEVQPNFNKLLNEQFFSSAESLDFANSAAAAGTINSWVENKTNNLIQNLISPQLLGPDTRLVLVNAIHFKGNWVHQFPERGTRERDFYLDETKTIKVQMMRKQQDFKYGEFPELDATAVELPYKDSDISMVIILPNSRTGLVDLENKLANVSLSDLTPLMYLTKVVVDMPKFKAEFATELTTPLKEMGMRRMFSSDAEFGNMLESKESLQVSTVVHKAFIEVNEKGTEAAAATGMAMRKKRDLEDFNEIQEFIVDHPFIFKIVQKTPSEAKIGASNLVIFEGKMENIAEIVLSTTANTKEIKDEL